MLKAGDVIRQNSSGEEYMIIANGYSTPEGTFAYFMKNGQMWCQFEVKDPSDITKEEFETQYPGDSWVHLDGSALFPKNVYKLGERFERTRTGERYILAQVDAYSISLINLRTGNRRSESVKVVDPHAITEEEFIDIAGPFGDIKEFRKIN